MVKIKPVWKGIIAGLSLFALYILLLTILNSFSHAMQQFALYWYFIIPLTIGFGIQVGLYSYIRNSIGTATLAATGGVSTGSMIACCLHHTTDVLPILGLSAASLFLLKYQVPFMILGIFSNLIGISMMLNTMQKKSISKNKIFKYNMESARNIIIMIAIVIVPLAFLYAGIISPDTNGATENQLQSITNDQNALSISAKPLNLQGETKFEISLNTHEGDLGFDLTKTSKLTDSDGNEYLPIKWDGSPQGGHHRTGTLTFPELKSKTGQMTLKLYNLYNIPERTFIWNL